MSEITDEEAIRITFTRSLSNVTDFSELADLDSDTLARDGIILVRRGTYKGNSGFVVRLIGQAFSGPGEEAPCGVVAFDHPHLYQAVQECRDTWLKEAVNLQWRQSGWWTSPFSRCWLQLKVSQRPHPALSQARRKIAQAGADLFKVLFEDGDDRLDDVADRLKKATADKRLNLTCYSDDFFVPWGMLYTGAIDERAEIDPEGFWGFRHVIEHSVDLFRPSARLTIENGKLQLGYCYEPFDKRVEKRATTQLSALQRHKLLMIVARTSLREIREAFSQRPYPDGFTHFYVHCEASGTKESPNINPPWFRIRGERVTAI